MGLRDLATTDTGCVMSDWEDRAQELGFSNVDDFWASAQANAAELAKVMGEGPLTPEQIRNLPLPGPVAVFEVLTVGRPHGFISKHGCYAITLDDERESRAVDAERRSFSFHLTPGGADVLARARLREWAVDRLKLAAFEVARVLDENGIPEREWPSGYNPTAAVAAVAEWKRRRAAGEGARPIED